MAAKGDTAARAGADPAATATPSYPRSRSPAPQPAHTGFHWRIWAAEGTATFVLIFGGLSVVCLAFGGGSPVPALLPSYGARLLLTGLLFSGLNSLLAVSPLGRLSGAHLNPAVTLAFRALHRLSDHDLAGYVTAQVVGAIAGAAALDATWGSVAASIDGGATVPSVSLAPAFALETAMTGLLLAVIVVFVSSLRLARWTPLAIWPVIAGLVWAGGRYTGTSLNPVRSAAPALVFGNLDSLWLYLVAPTLGALAVAVAWQRLGTMPQPKTAKLFHDPRYACSLASEMPAMPPA
jgi:aquaporin Z